MIRTLSAIYKTGLDILSTVRETATGLILAQLGDIVTGETESDGAELWQHVGFASRPAKGNKQTKKAVQAVALKGGSRDVIIATRDARGALLYGELAEGETCLYAPGESGDGQARILLKNDDSITLYTQDGQGGTSVAVQVRSDGTFKVIGPMGAITLDDSGITLLSGQSGLVLGADGTVTVSCKTFQVNGQNTLINTGSGALGATACASASAPNPALAIVHGPTGLTGIASATWTVGA